MPSQPSWFHRLDSILADLERLDSPYIDRLAVERIFGVRERRARQLMAGLPCLQIGNAVAVSRTALIERLQGTSSSERFQWETGRRKRVVEALEAARRHAAARQVEVPARADARDRVLADLPDGVVISPGELRISFAGAEDLAAKLFEVSQAMANDWSSFVKALAAPQST